MSKPKLPIFVIIIMFKNLFKKKTEIEILNEKYQTLLKEAHRLSVINRAKSDEVSAEADKIAKQIDALVKSAK